MPTSVSSSAFHDDNSINSSGTGDANSDDPNNHHTTRDRVTASIEIVDGMLVRTSPAGWLAD
jgi:hypothetical protein